MEGRDFIPTVPNYAAIRKSLVVKVTNIQISADSGIEPGTLWSEGKDLTNCANHATIRQCLAVKKVTQIFKVSVEPGVEPGTLWSEGKDLTMKCAKHATIRQCLVVKKVTKIFKVSAEQGIEPGT